ncbi:hypothetical protein [Desulfovibrio sp. ZJ369]|uniref:hypothetical protein n=1 Tax=Desulfovibrio sp. ZJ369 TaxID=2709793 RepID=UPI0013EB6E93|nr:hypothetical protein [Desulfovibrio sp. ZJ369]
MEVLIGTSFIILSPEAIFYSNWADTLVICETPAPVQREIALKKTGQDADFASRPAPCQARAAAGMYPRARLIAHVSLLLRGAKFFSCLSS